MPIELGLTRITQFLGYMQNPHLKTLLIHIAGTNGKGSTLAYLSSILTVARVRNGKFTSPHIIHYHDCISINNQTYPKDKFDKVYNDVVDLDKKMGSLLTEFELLVATAFKIFEVEKVQISLIETGVGGRLDATNVLLGYDNTKSGVIATAISKISLDHELLLGKGIRNIAKEKAGIMKPGVPCFVDASNEDAVLEVMQESSRDVGCPLTLVQPELSSSFINFSPLKGAYQASNLSLALAILKSLPYKISDEEIKEGISKTHWPGRLQVIEHPKLGKILIDGAHNEGAAIELGKYLRETYKDEPIVFVIGMTRGKEVDCLLKHILKNDDVVVPTLFTQPENMPWINPEETVKLADAAGKYSLVEKAGDDVYIRDVFSYLEGKHLGKPIVVCGSLYLCGDVLREV
ncbi:Dihydrofolate synthetase [Candida viswanathii]|uniref:Dihydrofolate synthetase n=1 Tax=Candida viswanathii TaxID=5486 RepID=A0A367YHE2_9ASCO|nr:Dihydrofolate synthetase [Candida viswanathii]